MGMYTELVIKCNVINNLPNDVKFILDFLFNPKSENDIWDDKMNIRSDIILPLHPFFKTPRWNQIGRCNSYYHIPCCLSFFDGSYLFSRSDLKNYDYEINCFLDWISPYLSQEEGQFIGWVWYEGWNEPNFIYKQKKVDMGVVL